MWNVRLDEAQARIKIARRNINNLRYADDTTLMAESEEELEFYNFIFIYLLNLFLTVLRLHCCMGFSLVAASGSYSMVSVCGLVEQGLQ